MKPDIKQVCKGISILFDEDAGRCLERMAKGILNEEPNTEVAYKMLFIRFFGRMKKELRDKPRSAAHSYRAEKVYAFVQHAFNEPFRNRLEEKAENMYGLGKVVFTQDEVIDLFLWFSEKEVTEFFGNIRRGQERLASQRAWERLQEKPTLKKEIEKLLNVR
jgi:hypothetical protein